ncbi:MAG: hypothetical protein GY832_26160 [Chloroflexi bacterium]|nr:hypothetical protein [Chloroflexota bacterium]
MWDDTRPNSQDALSVCRAGGKVAFFATHTELITAWAAAAQTKLIAENIDTDDLAAVEKCLAPCVGGRWVFRLWREVYTPVETLAVPANPDPDGV